jgi:hypothetical protein
MSLTQRYTHIPTAELNDQVIPSDDARFAELTCQNAIWSL